MESSWRLNVAIAGWSFSDWRLAARVIGAPFLAVVNPDSIEPTKFRLYFGDLSSGLPTSFVYVDIPEDAPHFPYGANVEPD